MKITTEKITPAAAKKMLDGNTRNRNLRPRVVQQYAADMKAGHWTAGADPIRIATDGTLLDGQHRLHAIVESKKRLQMVVVRGLSKSVMANIDTGARRSFSDVLRMSGYKNSSVLAAACRWGVMYEVGPECIRKRPPVSGAQMMEWLENNPDIEASVTKGVSVLHGGTTTGLRLSYVMIRHYAEDRGEADALFAAVASGASLTEHSPAFMLRRFMDNAAVMTSRVNPVTTQAVAIKAWNAHAEGRQLRALRYVQGGNKPESFPAITTSTSVGV